MKTKRTSVLKGAAIILLLSLMNIGLSAQLPEEPPMIDGSFSGNFPPQEWNVVNTGGGLSWNAYWGGGADGGNFTNINAGLSNECLLITPQLMPSAENSRLKFSIRASMEQADKTVFEVLLSTTNNAVESFRTTILTLKNEEGSLLPTVWTEKEADLSAYTDQPIYIAFRCRSNDLVSVHLDEIQGLPLAVFNHDLRINALLRKPAANLFADNSVVFSAVIENHGFAKETQNAELTMRVNGENLSAKTFRIDSGHIDTVNFSHTFAQSGTYELEFTLSEDENTANNTLCLNIEVFPPNTLQEDFNPENAPLPAEWRVRMENTTSAPAIINSPGAGGVNGYISFSGVSASTEKPARRFLITPQLHPADGSQFSYYAWTNNVYNNDDKQRMSVLVSTTGWEAADFTQTLTHYGVGNSPDALGTSPLKYTHDLSPYAGKDIFIAFMVEDEAYVTIINIDEVGSAVPLSSFENDARIQWASLDEPTRYWFAGEEIVVKALIDNFGTADIDNLKVALHADGQEVDALTVNIPAKQKADTLSLRFTVPEAGIYSLQVVLPDDENKANNTKALGQINVYPAGYFIEGFEGLDYNSFPPPYWQNELTAFGFGAWSLLSYNNFKGNGGASTYNAGQKLITPSLHITSSDSLCFWATGGNFAVLSSMNGEDWDTVYQGEQTPAYALHKIFFNDKAMDFYGDRYFAFVALSNSLNLDEVYGPMLSNRNRQFSLVAAGVNPHHVNVAGAEASFQAVVYNDGQQSGATLVTLFDGATELNSIPTRSIAPGEYDTVYLSCMFEYPQSARRLHATLSHDSYVFDNRIDFTCHVHQPERWMLEEDFEDPSHPFWLASDPNWTEKPSWNPWPPAGGENYLQRLFYTSAVGLLVSPYMDLRFNEYEVKLDIYRSNKNESRPDKVELALAPLPEWKDIIFIDSINRLITAYPVTAEEGWNTYTFKVNAGALDKGFFLIRAIGHLNEYNAGSYEAIGFDNLSIRPVLPMDAEVAEIVNPSDEVWGFKSVKTALQIRLLNRGTETLTEAVLAYGSQNEESGRIDWKGNLAPQTDTLLYITKDFTLPAGTDSLSVYVEVLHPDDINPMNNRAQKTLKVKQACALPFIADFEEERTWAEDWYNFSFGSEGTKWFYDATENGMIAAPFGNGCANSASMDDDLGAVNPDNWLVTPGLAIPYSKAYLSFYVQAADENYFAEHFSVLVSERSATDTAFFVPVHTQTLENNQLQHIVLELEGYKDEVIHIAFRHFGCTDQYRILLDSVYIYNPEGFTVTTGVEPAHAGSVLGEGGYLENEEVVLTAAAHTGYRFSGWYRKGKTDAEEPLSTENPYIFTCIGNDSIVALFEEKFFTISLSCGEGGSISPDGEQLVQEGKDLTVVITAGANHQIDNIRVDGISMGAVEEYTFVQVTENHTLEALFKEQTANSPLELSSVSVYPNPFKTELNVVSGLPMKSLRILNLEGKEMFSHMNLDGIHRFAFHGHLPAGLYLLVVECSDSRHRFQKRIIRVE